MTDYDISKALALAIGWPEVDVKSLDDERIWVYCGTRFVRDGYGPWRLFDYRDPVVIWPIAVRYDCFPYKSGGRWLVPGKIELVYYDSAEKAVAIAVIRETT